MKNSTPFLAVTLGLLMLLALPFRVPAQTTAWQYTAVGDSLAFGLWDFSGGGYVQRYRAYAVADTGGSVTLINRGIPGWTSAQLLNALRTDETLRAQLANSQIITFNIGGNDLLDALSSFQSGRCGGADNQDCLRSAIPNFKSNWSAIIAQILALRGSSNTVIRTMDIYNPAVNRLRAAGALAILKPYLEDINRYIFNTATANRIACARVYHAFNGLNGETDAADRGYMDNDGIHPNDLGHRVIADQFRSLSYFPLATPATTMQFQLPVYVVIENEPRVAVRVVRNGDLNVASSVDYATIDSTAPLRCDNATTGISFARCDYSSVVDTLHFAPGEAEKTFTVPITNDAHVEGTETFPIRLQSPIGGSIGTRGMASVQIQDNDLSGSANPIDASAFFVGMQYLDFLSREAEPEGLSAWLNVLNNCSDVNGNPACDRLTVSASFFLSQEFQLKGYFVYRFYKASFGRQPLYAEIIPDMRRITAATGEEVFARRLAFANSWVERREFKEAYPDTLSPAAFVDQLLQMAGVTLTGTVTRDSLVSDLQTRAKTRGQIVQAVVEHPAFDAKEFNPAFVAMQYYGYLRRDPEEDGYQAWLRYLNQNPADFRTMVNGFMNSQEYRLRFGQP